MFSFDNRDIPEVEKNILSYLGPRDLVRAKQVSKEWRSGVKRYLNHLKTSKSNVEKIKDLYKSAFLEPVTCFATVRLHKCEVDIAVNDAGEVYILSEGSILQIDIASMCLEAELPFPTAHAERWQNFTKREGSKELSVSDDGQRFTVMIHDEKKPMGEKRVDLFTFRRDMSGRALQWSSCGGPLSGGLASQHGKLNILKTVKNFAHTSLTDIVWLHDKTVAMFAMNSKEEDGKPESRVYGIDAARVPSLLAIVPMTSVRLHVVGTRVICHTKSQVMSNWAQLDLTRHNPEANSKDIIILDVWNPDSVRRGDACVTETDLDKHMKLMYWTTISGHPSVRHLRNGCQCKTCTCGSPKTMLRGL